MLHAADRLIVQRRNCDDHVLLALCVCFLRGQCGGSRGSQCSTSRFRTDAFQRYTFRGRRLQQAEEAYSSSSGTRLAKLTGKATNKNTKMCEGQKSATLSWHSGIVAYIFAPRVLCIYSMYLSIIVLDPVLILERDQDNNNSSTTVVLQ